MITQQTLQSTSHIVLTLLSEFHYLNINDSHLSQDIVTNMTNSSSSNSNISAHAEFTQTIAIIQTPFEPTYTHSLQFLYPSFFAHREAFANFFLPSDTFLAIPILFQAQTMIPFSLLFING